MGKSMGKIPVQMGPMGRRMMGLLGQAVLGGMLPPGLALLECAKELTLW